MKNIYLDNAATTPLHPEAFEAMKPFLLEKFGNPSSIHSFGRETRAALDESRDVIAKLLGAHPSEIYLTSSGTEATNFGLKGVSSKLKREGRNHVITSKAEHHATLETCEFLKELGFHVTHLDVDSYGMINPEDVQIAITPETGLISLMLVNNEVGTINPISEIAAIAKENHIIFHTDAVQAFGKIPVNVVELGVDLLSLSAHKIYGPKGIGVLYVRQGIEIEKLMHGGGQERGRRAGTENVAYAVGFAKAAELIVNSRENEMKRLSNLKSSLKIMLEDKFDFLLFNGHPTECLPNILSFSFDSRKFVIDGESLLINLDLAGIAVSSGSACTSGSVKPSHVLLAMGRDEETAKATIRFSFGRTTTFNDIEYVLEVLEGIVKRIGKTIS
ncbi:MAG: cysteine desulfurase family protein [Bacteroidota bacterium]|nr:cysteine desulfurase family protein [Bacteroidota bacterium]